MRTLAEISDRLKLYGDAELIYKAGVGYIAWHYSTGDNIEMLFIEAPGHGCELYAAMVNRLQSRGEQPYHSVFCFRLASNRQASKFYDKLGFAQVDLGQSIYRGDGTVLMWITWEGLVSRLREFKLVD